MNFSIAGGVPSGEQVAVSEVLQLTIPLSAVRSPQVASTSVPFVPGGGTFIYGVGLVLSGLTTTLPLTQPLKVNATFQITPALTSKLSAGGALYVAQQTGTSYTNVWFGYLFGLGIHINSDRPRFERDIEPWHLRSLPSRGDTAPADVAPVAA